MLRKDGLHRRYRLLHYGEKSENGIGEDNLYRNFMDQYNKLIGDGLTLTDVAKLLDVNKSTLWRSMRRQHFGGMTAERIKIFLEMDGIDYGK